MKIKYLMYFLMAAIVVLTTACPEDNPVDGSGIIIPVTGVSLDKSELIVSKGLRKLLPVNITPANATNKAVTWTSNHEAIEFDEKTGEMVVLDVTPDEVTITVETVEGKFKDSRKVKVVDIPALGVKVDRERVIVLSGLKETLKATVSPNAAANKNVTWESAKTNVATITPSGVVTAVAPGIVKMTVTTEDGGFKASTYVYVVEKPLPLDNPNLLLSPNFEDGTDNANPSNWTKVLQAWFMGFYTESPAAGLAAIGASHGTGNVNRLPLSDVFFNTGNGAYFRPTIVAAGATHAGRFQANVSGGFYQEVTVKPGGHYWVSIDIGYRNNDGNSAIQPWETLKILSPDGGIAFYEVPIDIGPTKITGSTTNKILTASGCFTVPPGVSKVRYQIDIRSWAATNNSPLTCFCNCQFREYTPLPDPE